MRLVGRSRKALFDSRRSSSNHILSGDVGLRRPAQLLHDVFNWVNNRRPDVDVDPRLDQRTFLVDPGEEGWDKIVKESSPMRAMSDLFWMSLPWLEIRKTLGSLNVLDIGCGGGYCLSRIEQMVNVKFDSYLGVDIQSHPDWPRISGDQLRVRFQAQGEDDPLPIPPSTNLVLSQSALEHVVPDLEMGRSLASHAACADHPVIQIHLVPAAVTLRLYRFHGVRQYTPRTISRISRLFGDETRPRLYSMGGRRCAAIHQQYILDSGDRREEDLDGYSKACRKAIEDDFKSDSRDPICYALVLQNGGAETLFDVCG